MASSTRRSAAAAAAAAAAVSAAVAPASPPDLVEPQDFRLADLAAGSSDTSWLDFANELAGPDGLVLSAFRGAARCLPAEQTKVESVRKIASFVCAAFSFDNQDGPFGQPLFHAAARALRVSSRYTFVTRALNQLIDELNASSPSAEARKRLTELLSVGESEYDEPGPPPTTVTLQAQKMLNQSAPSVLTSIVGTSDNAMRLLCQRIARCAIGPGALALPTPRDVQRSPAAAMPEATTWLLTSFESREDAGEFSVIEGVDGNAAVTAFLRFAEAARSGGPRPLIPFDPFPTLTKVLSFVSHQRFRAGPSVRLGLDRTVLTEVSSVLARAELMWVFDALAHAGEASSTWFFSAVCAAKPVLPGLLAAACAALGAAAGVPLDPTIRAFLDRERIHIVQQQCPVYNADTMTSVRILCAVLPRRQTIVAAPTRYQSAASAAGPVASASLTTRFRTHFHVTPAALANSIRSALGLPEFRWTSVLSLPLDKGPWASMPSRWPEINAELCRLLPHALLRGKCDQWRFVFATALLGSDARVIEPLHPQGVPRNYPTSPEEATALRSLVATEVANGWLEPLSDSDAIKARRPAPLNVVPKSPAPDGTRRWRLVADNSETRHRYFDGTGLRPVGVNASVSGTSLPYPRTPSLGEVASALLGPEPPSLLASLDVSVGFKRIRLSAASSVLFTVRLDGTTYVTTASTMGASSSSSFMNSVTDAVAQALSTADTKILAFCDDLLLAIRSGPDKAAGEVDRVRDAMSQLGIPPQSEKTALPSSSIEWIGTRLFAAGPHGPARLAMKDAAVSEAAAVLTALTRDAADQYALRLSRPPDQFPSLVVVTDASSTGFGFVLFDLRRTVNAKVNGLTRRCVDVTLFKGTWRSDIPQSVRSEFACAAMAVVVASSVAPGGNARLLSDSTTVVGGFNRMSPSARSAHSDDIAVPLALTLLRSRLVVHADHIQGSLNTVADFLSRVSPNGDDSIQVTPAFRVYADAAERTGLTLPFGKTAAATISTAFLYIGAARPQRFATATVASYYHNVIRLARLMLMEPDAATSRLVGSLVTKRIQRWGRPTIDKRGVFSRGDVVRAISLATVDPAVAAATAACWDAVSRAGSLLTRQSPGSRSDPTPRAQARVLKRRPFLVVELQVFEKMSKSWERLLFDTDPSSPQYNPTAVGAAAAIERLMAERRSPSEPLWRKRDGTHVVPSDLVAALQAANPHLRMCRITPHSFRISAASWLVNQAHVSRERVAALGRWHDPKSLDTYIRVNTVVPEFTRLDRSAMP
ncbi:hypothetical protein FNF31_01567 [Cafeteria roenbergensis]|uniref:Reverse transcriptase domain-containing protein n=1 Tax=Cafeteria roenbergensis TaxID=33653 RepID=A0A5A8DK95_CAFRO|nr:hypothetical protein FNF31_01567 [Cafeteria roenbergensis]